MKTLTDLHSAVDGMVGELAALTAEDVEALENVLERALTHVIIERHLRARDSGVSHLRPVQ